VNQEKWDRRFIELARHIASWSKDPSTQCGAVVTQGKRIVSVGYNGFPQGVEDSPARLGAREVKYDFVIHAEMNALMFAERQELKGATLYTWPFASCIRCAVHVVQVGIWRAVAPKLPRELVERWGESVARTREVFQEAQVEFVEL